MCCVVVCGLLVVRCCLLVVGDWSLDELRPLLGLLVGCSLLCVVCVCADVCWLVVECCYV